MTLSLVAHLLPALTSPAELTGKTVVVYDVLRATTTIAAALRSGARAVVPFATVEETLAARDRFTAGKAVCGGEREGLRIDGFDLGNSPCEYTPEAIGGRTLLFTTTNGTQAFELCRQAGTVFVGALINSVGLISNLVEELPVLNEVHFLCAGTRGKITREDVLGAGALIDRLADIAAEASIPVQMNDEARLAADAWRVLGLESNGNPSPSEIHKRLAEQLRQTQGGRNLIRLGLGRDIVDAAQLDTINHAPRLHLKTWEIR